MSIAKTDTNPNGSQSFAQLLARYERIIEISQQLNSTLDKAHLLSRIINAAKELTKTEASSILLLDPTSGELRFEQASNIKPSEMDEIVVPMEGSIAGWVVTHGEARVIEDVSLEPSFFGTVDDTIKFKTRNILAVPMRAQNKVIGALEAVNKTSGEPFSDDDIKTLTTLASHAAIAIENTRLFQQSDFMSEMVHELRTPLTALKISMSLLRNAELGEAERADTLNTMQNETERLISLTNEFLDLARLESGRSQLMVQPFELHDLIADCINVVVGQAQSKNIVLDIASEPVCTVNGDRDKIKRVVLNLLTNAIKYNLENGTVRVNWVIIREDDDVCVRLAVQDTGYGIPKEEQKNMFQKFYRVPSNADKAPGTGLGLAIARHIIESHSGSIWLESEVGVGSTFYISLPIEE